jgi:hypothetical protein
VFQGLEKGASFDGNFSLHPGKVRPELSFLIENGASLAVISRWTLAATQLETAVLLARRMGSCGELSWERGKCIIGL